LCFFFVAFLYDVGYYVSPLTVNCCVCHFRVAIMCSDDTLHMWLRSAYCNSAAVHIHRTPFCNICTKHTTQNSGCLHLESMVSELRYHYTVYSTTSLPTPNPAYLPTSLSNPATVTRPGQYVNSACLSVHLFRRKNISENRHH
jgi:hypothetical protein